MPILNKRLSMADSTRLEVMDFELVALREMMVRALRRRNECTQMCSLPPELLIHIFLFLHDDWPPTRECSGRGREERVHYRPGWAVVTHVCSHWRAVSGPSF